MKLSTNFLEKSTHLLFIAIVILASTILGVYLTSIYITGSPYPPFDFDGKFSINSLVEGGELLTISLLAFLLFIFYKPSYYPPSRVFLLTAGCVLLYMGADELFKIYQIFNSPNGSLNPWKIIYFSILLITPIIFFRDFKALWRYYPRETFLAFLGWGIFLLGGYGAEGFKSILDSWIDRRFQQGEFMGIFIEKSREGIEEFLEMIGESTIFYGVLLFFVKKIPIILPKSSNPK
jgi:hypothetical protein